MSLPLLNPARSLTPDLSEKRVNEREPVVDDPTHIAAGLLVHEARKLVHHQLVEEIVAGEGLREPAENPLPPRQKFRPCSRSLPLRRREPSRPPARRPHRPATLPRKIRTSTGPAFTSPASALSV